MNDRELRTLLRLLLAQRLELNAIESALTKAAIVSREQIKELRRQTAQTAEVWSSREEDDILTLLRLHSSPDANMQIPEIPAGHQ